MYGPIPTSGWRKSSYSDSGNGCVEVSLPAWRKSSYSGNGSNCVEVAVDGADVLVRDTKDDGTGPIITFTPEQWIAFLAEVVDGGLPRANGAVTVVRGGEDWLVHATDTGVTLRFTPAEWHAFHDGAADREFDLAAVPA